MSKIIKFVDVNDEQIDYISSRVPCLLLENFHMIVDYEFSDELTTKDENGDSIWVEGLIGKVISI